MSGRRRKGADLAQQAIDYLVQHDFVLTWGFDAADPPPEEVRQLLKPYFDDGEIEPTTSALLADYLVSRLREDYLPRNEPSRSGQGCAPCSRRPACRVVFGDDG